VTIDGVWIDDWIYWPLQEAMALSLIYTLHKSLEHMLSSQSVFISRFLVTDPNNVICLRPHWLANVAQLTNESESYVTTDGQPASLSWNKAPFWGLWQLRVCWFEAPSLMRGRVCRFQLLLALASAVIFWSESYILLFQIRDFHFRRLLRLAWSRWRYSTPPPHGLTN
jgi:hypothetical protein